MAIEDSICLLPIVTQATSWPTPFADSLDDSLAYSLADSLANSPAKP